MKKEAIILAGGLGTRLRGVIADIPKPMADIAGKPFLVYLLHYLQKYDITEVVLAVGYKHEVIQNYFGDKFNGINICYAIENEPLGTGGAIMNALAASKSDTPLLLNGDSFFDLDLNKFYEFHDRSHSDISIALKTMEKFDRYGTVTLDGNKIIKFEEKKFKEQGLINTGIYLLNKSFLSSLDLPQKFSFESDILEKYVTAKNFNGMVASGYFIDIGIPEDYQKAQTAFKL